MADKIVISGSEEDLKATITLLVGIRALLEDIQTEGVVVNRPPISPEFDDYLQLTVHWIGKIPLTQKYHRIEKSVRLKSIDPKTVGIERLQALAKDVKRKFDKIQFKTGHCKVKYTKWKDGLQVWGYFENEQTGYQIIKALGDVINKPVDRKLLKHEYISDPKAFDSKPSKISVAGQLVRPPAKAPIVSMKFNKATILFPWIGHVEKLCDKKGYIIPNLAFLKGYED